MEFYNCRVCGKHTPNRWKRETAQYCSRECRYKGQYKEYPLPRPSVELSGETRLINDLFIINAEYYDWLNQYRWHLGDTGYAMWRNKINGKKTTLRLHRLVINAKPGEIVDHIDRNKLNNTKSNLRIVTQLENIRNTYLYDNAKGYCWDSTRRRWLVSIRKKHYGRFKTEQEALNKVEEVRNGRF